MRIMVDGNPVDYEVGDNLLVAMLKANQHPTGGGCLCCGGDCPHCLATVDGVSYVRTCQVRAKPGMIVARDHYGGKCPPLPEPDDHTPGTHVLARNVHCDVVVIGAGESGRAAADEAQAAGKRVVMLDVGLGQEAIGIYAGPLVVARTDEGMLQVHAKEEVIVATGAAEIQPVAPGNLLDGLVTARAATQLAQAGVDLGHIVAIGTPPAGIDAQVVAGRVVRIESPTSPALTPPSIPPNSGGEGGGTLNSAPTPSTLGESRVPPLVLGGARGGLGNKVSAVVVRDTEGNERRYKCNTVSFGLGLHPRDALRRQGHDMAQVRAVGNAARESDIPPCPLTGIVCPCSAVSVDDLQYTWDHGFRELELVKRSTLAGTGTCQGSACLPHIRSFLADRGKELQAPFTARPVTRQLTMAEIAAGAHYHPMARTALDAEHRKLGAQMERSGSWWRPWNYGDVWEEYWAVRKAVSIMDVSTLGKMRLTGPDVLEFLERLYPTRVRTIKTGRSRYVLMLNQRGSVREDGMISKESDGCYLLTFTSGGVSHSERWLRDWATSWGLDVRILNQTWALGAINVTGPLANELLKRAGVSDPPKWLRHKEAEVAGVPCRLFRLSFTGELSYELHHPAQHSVKLWRSLLDLGQELGIKPHGVQALRTLRLEKGHIIVGQDSDMSSTPRRLHHEWAVKLSKTRFIGRQAILRTNKIEQDRMLVGLEMDENVPFEGEMIWLDPSTSSGHRLKEYVGVVTSSSWSPLLGKVIMLAWLNYVDGKLPTEVTINGHTARRVDLPFYDKEATRARV
ncbi:MAG: glycine cleavage T C-terminal barrel domain-containing protein [Ardenticatenaceae bacterium]